MKKIMADRPKFVYFLVRFLLILALVLLIVFESDLPDKILGLPKLLLIFFMFASIFLVGWGWRVVEWFRRRN
jgi:hypothetical protein